METSVKTAMPLSKKSFLSNYSLIPGPGKYLVQASKSNEVFDAALGKNKYIVNLKAISSANTGKVQSLFAGKESIDITELNGLTMAHNIIINNGNEDVPANGEMVEVQFGYVITKAGEEKLVPTFMKVQKAAKAASFANLLSDEVPTLETSDKAIA